MKINFKSSTAKTSQKKRTSAVKKQLELTEIDVVENKIDPLYTIFEKHLYDFQANERDGSESDFLNAIVDDYIKYLTSKHVVIPFQWKKYILEEIFLQTKQMLVKKTYGCLSITEFITRQTDLEELKKSSKRRYTKLTG